MFFWGSLGGLLGILEGRLIHLLKSVLCTRFSFVDFFFFFEKDFNHAGHFILYDRN